MVFQKYDGWLTDYNEEKTKSMTVYKEVRTQIDFFFTFFLTSGHKSSHITMASMEKANLKSKLIPLDFSIEYNLLIAKKSVLPYKHIIGNLKIVSEAQKDIIVVH